jgi:general secretion pathway protein B
MAGPNAAYTRPPVPAAQPPGAPGTDPGGLGTPTRYVEPGTETPAPAPRSPEDSREESARAAGTQTGSRGVQGGSGESAANPDDYAPATEPGQSQGPGLHVRRGTEEGVPLYSQLATAPGSGIPELRLDLHAWDQKPENRFVLINMKRLREGDALPEGVKVEAITRDGVILSHNGTRFLLPSP